MAIYDEINVTIATFSVNSNRQMYYSEHQNNVFLPDYKGSVLLNAFYIRKRVRREVRNYVKLEVTKNYFRPLYMYCITYVLYSIILNIDAYTHLYILFLQILYL